MIYGGGRGRFEAWIGLASGWIVVLLAVLAGYYVLRNLNLSPTLQILWYVLIGIAVLRAAYRTWFFWRKQGEGE